MKDLDLKKGKTERKNDRIVDISKGEGLKGSPSSFPVGQERLKLVPNYGVVQF